MSIALGYLNLSVLGDCRRSTLLTRGFTLITPKTLSHRIDGGGGTQQGNTRGESHNATDDSYLNSQLWSRTAAAAARWRLPSRLRDDPGGQAGASPAEASETWSTIRSPPCVLRPAPCGTPRSSAVPAGCRRRRPRAIGAVASSISYKTPLSYFGIATRSSYLQINPHFGLRLFSTIHIFT